MSWQGNWPQMQQPGLVPGYPPPAAAAGQLPASAPVVDYGDQYKQWQWQQYHMQYAQWHAQYGEQYARETGKSLPPVAAPALPMQPMQPMQPPLPTQPYPPAETPFSVLNMVAPPPPSEPHPDELNAKQAQEKPPLPEEKSAEELAFDEQFRKWEQEFETWKRKNKNHPDKAAYREYEQKCMNSRKKLLERREQLRQKRIAQNLAAQSAGCSGGGAQYPSYPPLPVTTAPPPPPPSDPPPPPNGEKRGVPRQKNHRAQDSCEATNLSLENVFCQSASNGEASGGIPGLDLIDEHPAPQPKKIKLEEEEDDEPPVMEVIDLANNEEDPGNPDIADPNSTATALSSLLSDPKVNALLQLVGKSIAGGSGNGNGPTGSNNGVTNPLVAALAQLTSARTAHVMEGEKLNQNLENRPKVACAQNEEPSSSNSGGGTGGGGSAVSGGNVPVRHGVAEEGSSGRRNLIDFNPHVPPPLLDVDLSRPPPLMHANKRQKSDRWNQNNGGLGEQRPSQNGSFVGGYGADGSPLVKVPRFDRPPPPFGSRDIDYQIDPELGRPVAVPKPDWMTEDEYQEIYDRYEHVANFGERKTKMELAIQVLRQGKIRDGRMGPGEGPPVPAPPLAHNQVRGGMPKPLVTVKTETILNDKPDEFFQPQQVFDYTNCRAPPVPPPANHSTPTGRVIDYGHCASGQFNSANINNRGHNRRDGFRNSHSSGPSHEFGSNTQRFDYNHSRVANIAPSNNASSMAAEQHRKTWPLESQSVANDRSVPGLERLAQMHLNPNPEESNPNYPSKFLLMNDNRPSCLSTKRGKRPSSIRKQKLKQQMKQQEQHSSSTPQTDAATVDGEAVVCKQEPPLDLDDLSSDDDTTVEERAPDGDHSTDDGGRQIKQDLPDDRSESAISSHSSQPAHSVQRLLDIEELLLPPGRLTRPARICLLVRGLPGSGKSFLARLIKTKEQSFGPSPRVLSLDDYFLVDAEVEEKDPVTGKLTKVMRSQYEFDEEMEDVYVQNLLKAFKRTISERLFNFVIVDCCNHRLDYYCEFHNYARSNGFKVYTCTMQTDVDVCARQNIHHRTAEEIQAYADSWAMAPDDHVQINFNGLLQTDQQDDTDTTVADMELAAPEEEPYAGLGRNQDQAEAATSHDEANDDSADSTVECDLFASKWDNDASEQNLARLDGTSKPLKRPPTLEDYLQLDDISDEDGGEQGPKKKRVRWADVEEQKAQKKMRQMGFVVGVTDWSRMMDPTQGSSALTQTKYIDKIKKKP